VKKELQLGIFILLGIAALSISILAIKNVRLEKGYEVHIYFNEVANLLEKAWVRVSGVKVGYVKTITLDNEKAKITIWVKDEIKIHQNARVNISATGILGVKYIQLNLGSPPSPVLKDGDKLTGNDPISIDEMLNDAMGGMKNITKSLSGFAGDGKLGENINELIRNASELIELFNKNISDKQVSGFVKDITDSASQLNNISKDIEQITGDKKEDIKDIIANLKSVSEKLDKMLKDIDSGNTMVGKLLNDKQMGEDLKKTVESIRDTTAEAKKTIARFNLFKAYWNYDLRTDNNSVSKSDIGIEVRPRENKFYYIGVTNAGGDITGIEKENTFNVLLGRDFSPFFTGYAGAIRSAGGIGIKIRPFYKINMLNRLELKSEVYDFGRKIPKKQPRVNVGARVKFTDWAYMGIQSEDVLVDPNLHTNMNINFEDEDISYLLGLIGLSN